MTKATNNNNGKEKPKFLTKLSILLAFLNVAGYSFLSNDASTRNLEIIVSSVLIFVSFWIIYKFNKGSNWARLLVLATSVLALTNIFLIQDFNLIAKYVIVIEAVLAVYLLYWLNTVNVKNYFYSKK